SFFVCLTDRLSFTRSLVYLFTFTTPLYFRDRSFPSSCPKNKSVKVKTYTTYSTPFAPSAPRINVQPNNQTDNKQCHHSPSPSCPVPPPSPPTTSTPHHPTHPLHHQHPPSCWLHTSRSTARTNRRPSTAPCAPGPRCRRCPPLTRCPTSCVSVL
ncbi:hypothetical protein JOL62DRAFT_603562, partial [Phyllosticta paracitricarpa]